MRYLNFPTNIGRGHNGPTSMYIDMVACMYKQSVGVKSRFVYRCLWNGRASMAHAERICAIRERVPHTLRHDPAKPHEYDKLKSYECGPLLTGIQSPRITTHVVYHIGISEHKLRRPLKVVVFRSLRCTLVYIRCLASDPTLSAGCCSYSNTSRKATHPRNVKCSLSLICSKM